MTTDYGRIVKTQLPRPIPGRPMRSALRSLLLPALAALFLAGCASGPPMNQSSTPWRWQSYTGRTIQTDHYLIHTTIPDPAINDRLARTLEMGMSFYQNLIPTPPDPEPLECFVFATRTEWADYTLATTGRDASLYLQMVHGGYTIGDQFVCYLGNEPDMRSIAAHEGFHQYCARRFKTRLCPALEEGLATQFETLDIDRPQDKLPAHVRHLETISKAMRDQIMIPLPTLLKLDAGDVVKRSPQLTFVFYAQCWALARFLTTDATYQPKFQAFLHACVTGLDEEDRKLDPARRVEKYLGDLDALDAAYRRNVEKMSKSLGADSGGN